MLSLVAQHANATAARHLAAGIFGRQVAHRGGERCGARALHQHRRQHRGAGALRWLAEHDAARVGETRHQSAVAQHPAEGLAWREAAACTRTLLRGQQALVDRDLISRLDAESGQRAAQGLRRNVEGHAGFDRCAGRSGRLRRLLGDGERCLQYCRQDCATQNMLPRLRSRPHDLAALCRPRLQHHTNPQACPADCD
jgi:hypothetical protein